MRDLEELSGLPIGLDDAGLLVFGSDVIVDEHRERLLDALSPVVMTPDAARGSGDIAYYMDNGVYDRADAGRLAGVRMRYELTLMPPRTVGNEYVKTFGHIHHKEPVSGLEWTEVVEVLTGTAHFLLQTLDLTGPDADVVYLIEAGPGQKVLLPPGFDHCTINPGDEPLLFSDVIALGVAGDYGRFVATRGAAYLEVNGADGPEMIPNPTYRRVAPLTPVTPRDYPELHLTSTEPLYTVFVATRGELWPFLCDPRLFYPAFPDLRAVFAA
jgi:glucose-6-phosphate isomerase